MSSDCIFITRRSRYNSFSERFDDYVEAIDAEFHLPIGKVTKQIRRWSFTSSKPIHASAPGDAIEPDSGFPFPMMPSQSERDLDAKDELHWRPT
ncbi:hypothetical protein H0H93_002038, partial [Arthromyces matolae]